MNVQPTELPGAVVIEPEVFYDARGFFLETFQKARFQQAGLEADFVQDNHSRSSRGALRGLHYQIEHPQGKLLRVIRGEVFDVAVDLRRRWPTFGRWVGVVLSEENHRLFYVPPGVAHGFCVTSDVAELVYKCTDYYYPQHERTLLWNDPALAIAWPVCEPLLSEKDRRGLPLAEAPTFDLGAPAPRPPG
jgi:dTDP-4-dehydrorhamnose 3,5-epimerase